MSRSTPRARKLKSGAAATDASAVPRDETPEAVAARKRAYEDANRIAKRYIVPALILVPVLLFLVFYKLYGTGSPAVAPRTGFNQQQRQRPVWTAPTGGKPAAKKAAKKKAEVPVKDKVKPAEGDTASSGRAETKMDQKQTEEFARLMMEQLAKLAKGNNPDLKLTFNNEEINLGGGAGAGAPADGAEKKADGSNADAEVVADEEVDLD